MDKITPIFPSEEPIPIEYFEHLYNLLYITSLHICRSIENSLYVWFLNVNYTLYHSTLYS